jgi:hypothetical protein
MALSFTHAWLEAIIQFIWTFSLTVMSSPSEEQLCPNCGNFPLPRIEYPCLSICTDKFFESHRIAVNLTKDIAFLVLALEVPDVHGKANFVKIMITGSH